MPTLVMDRVAEHVLSNWHANNLSLVTLKSTLTILANILNLYLGADVFKEYIFLGSY